jgi:hypothetical protein
MGMDNGMSVFNGCSTIAAAGGKILQQEFDPSGATETVLLQDVVLDPLVKSSASLVRVNQASSFFSTNVPGRHCSPARKPLSERMRSFYLHKSLLSHEENQVFHITGVHCLFVYSSTGQALTLGHPTRYTMPACGPSASSMHSTTH